MAGAEGGAAGQRDPALTVDELDPRQRQATRTYFEDQVYPVLTPLAIDPAHKFPHISHRSINFAVALNDPDLGRYARVKVPDNLPRFVPVPPPGGQGGGDRGGGPPADPSGVAGVDHRGLPRPALRRGARDGRYLFRVTRDADQEIREREGENLLSAVQESLRERFFGFVVRYECTGDMPDPLRSLLIREMRAERAHQEVGQPPLGLADLTSLLALDRPDLKYPLRPPRPGGAGGGRTSSALSGAGTSSCTTPSTSFAPVIQFIEAAAADPDVLAIKQTLYRVGNNSPIVEALKRAGERQTGGRPAGAQGPRRRGEQHRVGPGAGGGRGTWCTASWASRRTPRPPWWCAARGRDQALRAPGDGELQRPPPAATPTSVCSPAARSWGRT